MTTADPSFKQLFARALQAQREGHFQQAEMLCRQILAHEAGHIDARQLLAMLCSRRGDHAEAERCLSQAITLQAGNPLLHNNLGEARRRSGDLAGAEQSYRRALALAPDFAEAHYNLANLLKACQLQAAETHYHTALRLKPTYSSARYNLANLWLEQGDATAAEAGYRQALALRPNHAAARNNLGVALQELRRDAEAEACFRQAAALKPDFAEPLRNLATLLEQQSRPAEARAAFGQYLRRAPDDAMQRLRMETLCPLIAASNTEIDAYREHLAATLARYADQPPPIDMTTLHRTGAPPPFMLPYQGRADRRLREQWAALFKERIPAYTPEISRSGKPHIGFVVTHGHEGVFLKCVAGLLKQLPGERFRLTVVCSRNSPPRLQQGIQNPAVEYLPLEPQLDQAAAQIVGARIDLLYHWQIGSDCTNYFLPFFNAAPIQCAFWGMMFTSGIPAVRYLTSSEQLETPQGDEHYSETLVRFRRLPTFYYRPPVPARPAPREHFGFNDQQRLYFCPQNLRKLHPDFDPLLAAILRRDRQGRLLLIEDPYPQLAAQLRRRFAQIMPDVLDQIEFLPRMAPPAYLALTARVDVVLDTLHFGGGANTTYDAFAAGTPLVTLPTAYQRGRYALAAYQQMGIAGGIARNPEDYVNIALRLAHERGEQQQLRAQIAAASGELFEDIAAVQEIADFFDLVVARARTSNTGQND